MNNADRFKQTFGIYAEEFWSFDEKQMLDWLNADVPDTNVGDTTLKNVIYSPVQMVMDYAVNATDFSASSDTISRQASIDAMIEWYGCEPSDIDDFKKILAKQPSVQPEPLTDKEQRIFLAAMRREEKICKDVDEEWQEAYAESLVEVCREIERKVKKALWTN